MDDSSSPVWFPALPRGINKDIAEGRFRPAPECPGRDDGPGFEGTRWHQVIQRARVTKAGPRTQMMMGDPPGIALIGFCSDEGVRRNQGRPGAAQGPLAIRQALASMTMPAQLLPNERRHSPPFLVDAGDVVCEDGDLERAQLALARAVSRYQADNYRTIVIGGGHEVAMGHWMGLAERSIRAYPPQVLNLDAHLDMRPYGPKAPATSGNSFTAIASRIKRVRGSLPEDWYTCLGVQAFGNSAPMLEMAASMGVHIVEAHELTPDKWTAMAQTYPEERLLPFWTRGDSTVRPLHVTICLDVFAAAFAPGVSALNGAGLVPDAAFWQWIRALARHPRLLGVDIAELSPPYDQDGRTARLAAALVYEFVVGMSSTPHRREILINISPLWMDAVFDTDAASNRRSRPHP